MFIISQHYLRHINLFKWVFWYNISSIYINTLNFDITQYIKLHITTLFKKHFLLITSISGASNYLRAPSFVHLVCMTRCLLESIDCLFAGCLKDLSWFINVCYMSNQGRVNTRKEHVIKWNRRLMNHKLKTLETRISFKNIVASDL